MNSASLVIINVVHVDRITIVETKRYTPISGNRYCPKTSKRSFERVKSEAGKVHLIRPTAAVQYCKNIAKFFNMCRGHPSCRFTIKKGLDPAMLKRPIIFRRLSLVNCHNDM